jgi:hypothetical protein
MGVGEAVVCAGLVGGLPELGRELERLPVVCQGRVRAAGGVVEAAQAVQGLVGDAG